MGRHIADTKAYEKIVGTFKKHKSGITLADVAAGTGLSLDRVKTLVPMAADEYSARLEVTESGEILYSFPRGFSSRYRGPGVALNRCLSAFSRFAVSAGTVLFKAWIMVMLVGYFVLFVAIALAALVLSMAASRNNNRGGGGGVNASLGIFNLIIRIWFYSELFSAGRRSAGWQGSAWDTRAPKKKGRPLHKAIFSFVFGDGDPNRDHLTQEKKEFVAYIRKRRGVVSLPELMILSGQSPQKAESRITGLCAEFGGSPEVTEEGTIVYRFDEILLSGEKKKQENAGGPVSTLYKKPRLFSSNQGKMNFWFGLINGVNLLFGSYFFYNSMAIGRILTEEALQAAGIYGMVYYFLTAAAINPLPVIQIGLGIVPLLFSAFFWIIPAVRLWLLKKENNAIRMGNFRGFFFSRIWASPEGFKPSGLDPREDECRPANLAAAKDAALKEMGTYSFPNVSLDKERNEIFDFTELRREKDALEKYRRTVDVVKTGETVFDSGT